MLRKLAIPSFAILLGAAAVPAQEPPSPRAVIRTETRLVLVDAVVRDKKEKVVRDLTTSDFRLFEDGKEQKIASVSIESAGVAPEKAQKKYLLFLFDNMLTTVDEQVQMRREAAKFVKSWAGPDRYMAVAEFTGSMGIARNFTVDPGPVAASVSLTHTMSTTIDSAAYEDLQQNPNSAPQSGSAIVGAAQSQTAARSSAPAVGSAPISDPRRASRETLLAVRGDLLQGMVAVANSLAAIRGRKAVALIGSPSKDAPTDAALFASVVAAFNRANVAVYSNHTPGFTSLVNDTGGREFNRVPDLAGELGKLAEEQAEHYVLSFVPEDSTRDCHSLRVDVTRPGVDVRARKSYCNTARLEALPPDASKAVEARAAAAAGNVAASLALPYFYASANIAKVNVAMEIDAANIPFQKVKGKPHAEVNVVGVAYKGDGAVGGRFSDVVSLDFPGDKEVDAFRKRPLHYEYQFDLPPGEYKLRVSFSAGEQNFGKAEAPLTIAPWDGRAFRLSSVALAKLTHPAADLTAELDLGSLEGRRPLIAGSLEIAPFGGSRFRRGEPCRWYAEIYNAKASDTTVEYRLLDRDTGGLRGNAAPKPVADFARGSGAISVSFEVPVNSFPPGAYRLEVKAVNRASGESASSAVDLDIE